MVLTAAMVSGSNNGSRDSKSWFVEKTIYVIWIERNSFISYQQESYYRSVRGIVKTSVFTSVCELIFFLANNIIWKQRNIIGYFW